MAYTLTYSDDVKGWTSFYSYIPESMNSIGNSFYTFKDGQVYKHNVKDGSRNSFYGEAPANTEIETVLNDSPSDVKIFKTISTEGDSSSWDVVINTDLSSGHINKESFSTKEGVQEAYIRRDDTDLTNTTYLSVQGIGLVESLNGLSITFENDIPSGVYVNDKMYSVNGSSKQLVGTIQSIDGNVITLDQALVTPSIGGFCFSAKNPVVESNGIRGYYAEVRLINNQSGPLELYAINSEIVKSFA